MFEPSRDTKTKTKTRFAIHRVPRDGWREETLAALDALFAHARRAAPFFRSADDASALDPNEKEKEKGWSLVNDADDYHGRIFARDWERRCCAAMLAWYVDVRGTKKEDDWTRHALDDVLRVLGAANASDEEARAATSSDGRERFPVDAAARLRREGSSGSRGDDEACAKVVELDARLRWNLMMDA